MNLIERTLPGRKTSLFFALLVFAVGSVFLWFDKIGGSEWMTVSLYVLSAYVVKRWQSEKLNGNNHQA